MKGTTVIPCLLCGTRTGLHGFSFDKNGSYSSPKTASLTVMKSVWDVESSSWKLVRQ